jgi:hypothetical protein
MNFHGCPPSHEDDFKSTSFTKMDYKKTMKFEVKTFQISPHMFKKLSRAWFEF